MSPARLVLLGKPGCHLCEEMREAVEEVLPAWDAVLEEQDVRADAALSRRYLWEIPVLLLEGEEVARHRITPEELSAHLARHAVGRRPPAST